VKILLLQNSNSYAGREYLQALNETFIFLDVVSIGDFPEVNSLEEERCSGKWKPKAFAELIKHEGMEYRFKSLTDEKFLNFLQSKKYDFGIQGGTGILRQSTIEKFRYGILNFHPGDLPKYRGCSAPEWQIVEGKPVICTCHIIDEGIDTGAIYKKKKLLLDVSNYYDFRSGIYPEIAKFVVDVIEELITNKGDNFHLKEQDESKAIYRKFIGHSVIEQLQECMPSYE
tara:strand:+ start:2065 stop:2748 length:684 start_codon:yes stop_codon:yes gene_type:complete